MSLIHIALKSEDKKMIFFFLKLITEWNVKE
jgi:hypothetical protein